jgi:trimethylamine---corrinoid protein Co-methyltransferase
MASKFDKLNILTEDQLKLVHDKTIKLLSTTGFRFIHEEVVNIFKNHGFKTDHDIVFFTEASINQAIENVGNSFTLMARNPKYNIEFDMDTFSPGIGGGATWVVDADNTCRPATVEDAINCMKLAQMLEQVEIWRPLLFPMDIEGSLNPFWLAFHSVMYTDKPHHYTGHEVLDIIRIGYGVSRETMIKDAEKSLSYGQSSVNVISPLTLATSPCETLLEYVRHGIVFNLAPMPSGSTTAPITLPGEIIQQNAENLAPLVLCQLLKPGMTILYGTIGSHTDMRNMATIFGSPETRILEYAAAQMAKHYNMLSRGGVGMTDSPCSDFQAGAESMFQFVNVARAGINFMPGMGHLGSFMGGSLAKLVLDAELVDYTKRFMKPLEFTEDSMATDLMEKVGPGGHFISEPHTLKHCRSEYMVPSIFARESYDAWTKKDYPTAMQLAANKAEKMLGQYEMPKIDREIRKDLENYMEKTYKINLKL